MDLLRRYAPPLAALVALLITMQVLDWPGCADEVGHGASAPVADTGGPLPAGGDAGHAGDGTPDCLCHVVFVPAPALPVLGTPVLSEVTLVPFQGGLRAVPLLPPEHVPLA